MRHSFSLRDAFVQTRDQGGQAQPPELDTPWRTEYGKNTRGRREEKEAILHKNLEKLLGL